MLCRDSCDLAFRKKDNPTSLKRAVREALSRTAARACGVGILSLGLAGISSHAEAAASGDGSSGFVLKGADSRSYSGTSVSDAGDVNADGINDILIGA